MRMARRGVVAAALVALGAGAAGYATGSSAAPTASPQGASAVSPQLPPSVIAASFAPHSHWKPEKAVYGTTSTDDIPVTMRDGTVLRVNVIYPTDPKTGKVAAGRFPV